MQFHGLKLNDKMQFMPGETKRRSDFIKLIKNGKRFTEDIKVFREPKSDKQLGVIWGLMIDHTIAQANDLGIDVSDFLKYLLDDRIPKGQGLTPDFLHELMYVICPTTDEDGRRITLSKMNTEQASDLFERFRNIVAPLGIVISDPNPNWKKKT